MMHANDHDLILRALDEELSPEETKRLRRLVHSSPEARAELETLRDMRTLIAKHGSASFEPGFSSRVMAELRARPTRNERPPKPRHTKRWQPVGWTLAALVVLIGLGLAFLHWPRRVHVPYGNTETATLPDGSTVELSAGSTLEYTPFWATSTRRVTLNGEAFFEVAHDGDRPFVVETFNARVVVHGTQFNVRAWEEDTARETTVTLAAGRVAVVPRMPAADSTLLAPGETSVVTGDTTRATPPTAIPLDRALSWRSGGISFANQPLGSVLRTLERRFDLRIQLAETDLTDRAVTYLNPQPTSAASVLSDVCHVLDLRYRQTADGYVVLRK